MTTDKAPQKVSLFSGPPRKLLLHEPHFDLEGSFTLELDDPLLADDTHHKVRIKRDKQGKLKPVKIKLERSTPPGKYSSHLKSSSANIPIELEVQENIALSMSPPQLAVEGCSGTRVTCSLVLTNKGNVSLDIPRNHHLGIYDDDGVETAFASTYRMDEDDPIELFGNFIHKLRDGYGGLLKLRIIKGYGALPAGASRKVSIEVALQKKLIPRHDYHGVWSLFNSHFTVSISVKA